MKRIFFDPAAFPEEASALAAIPEDTAVRFFGIDLTSPAEGIAALIGARRRGLTTALLPVLAEPYEGTLRSIIEAIAATAGEDDRAAQISALSSGQLLVNGKQPHELATLAQRHLDAAALALRVADVLIVGAPGERDRWVRGLNRAFRRFALLPVATMGDERATALDDAAVTVYGPSMSRAALAVYAAVLVRLRLDVRVICAENAMERPTTRVVVAPEWRSMRARTLATLGHHVVAPNAMRVDDCDERIFGYAAPDLRGMQSAVTAALVASGGSDRVPSSPEETLRTVARYAAARLDGRRISIVIRTYDRPELLRRAVASVAAQTYRNVEIVVVNNGGEDVRSIVEAAANGRPYRYETLDQRRHISAASNAGARAASGTFVGYLDDDDLIYGDHCALAVEAIERTQADVVFTTCLAEYAQMNGDEKHVLGYQIYLDREFHPDDIYVSNLSPIHTIVHNRTVFDRFGYFDEDLPVTDDWELWLRIASLGARFVRVDRVTCEYSWRYDPVRGNMTIEHQWDFVGAYRTITARYASGIEGRASLHTAQANMLADQERRANEAADPSRRAGIVIGAMSSSVVPVAPIPSDERSPA
ncbi:MAG TPA: glycosyltransferase [Candidatus Baltobacteraceae bacterium]